jgi:hypothetical protein
MAKFVIRAGQEWLQVEARFGAQPTPRQGDAEDLLVVIVEEMGRTQAQFSPLDGSAHKQINTCRG